MARSEARAGSISKLEQISGSIKEARTDSLIFDNRTRNQIIPIELDIATGYVLESSMRVRSKWRKLKIVLNAKPIQNRIWIQLGLHREFYPNSWKSIELTERARWAHTYWFVMGAIIQGKIGEREWGYLRSWFWAVGGSKLRILGQIVHILQVHASRLS